MGEGSVNRIEVEKSEKKLRGLLKSDDGRAAIANILGVRVSTISKQADQQEIPLVCTLVPSHSGPKPQMTGAFQQMIKAAEGVCHVIPRPSISSSVVHWVRNMLLKELYASKLPFTHVLFCDDDIAPPEDTLIKLLSHNKDIIAAACTVRQDPPLPNFRTYNEKTHRFSTAFEWNGEGLIEVGAVGTGVMLISRNALEKVAEYYLSCQYEKEFMGLTDTSAMEATRRQHFTDTHNAWWFQFLRHPDGADEFGEDISFCFKALRCGLKIFVDTTVRPLHFGDYGYGMDDYMEYQKQVIAAQESRKTESRIVVTD